MALSLPEDCFEGKVAASDLGIIVSTLDKMVLGVQKSRKTA